MIFVDRLIWNELNIAHIARHDVRPEEVEEVCHGSYIVLDVHHGRFLVIGPTNHGRAMSVILDPEREPGVYYPVTARSADRKERLLYLQRKGVSL